MYDVLDKLRSSSGYSRSKLVEVPLVYCICTTRRDGDFDPGTMREPLQSICVRNRARVVPNPDFVCGMLRKRGLLPQIGLVTPGWFPCV